MCCFRWSLLVFITFKPHCPIRPSRGNRTRLQHLRPLTLKQKKKRICFWFWREKQRSACNHPWLWRILWLTFGSETQQSGLTAESVADERLSIWFSMNTLHLSVLRTGTTRSHFDFYHSLVINCWPRKHRFKGFFTSALLKNDRLRRRTTGAETSSCPRLYY